MLENQQTGKPANQHTGDTEIWRAGTPETEGKGRRTGYPKATYRLSPEALEAIDETKRMLRRRYKIKASLEEIAEEAILAACHDLLENQQASMLVLKFSGKQEDQQTGGPP